MLPDLSDHNVVDLQICESVSELLDAIDIQKSLGPESKFILARLVPIRRHSECQINKAGYKSGQPRDDNGRWVRQSQIMDAAGDPTLADELRSNVNKPEERRKLDAAIVDAVEKNQGFAYDFFEPEELAVAEKTIHKSTQLRYSRHSS